MPNKKQKKHPSWRESRKQDLSIGRPWTCTNPHCLHRNRWTTLVCSKCRRSRSRSTGRPSRRCRVTLRSRSRRAHGREASRRRDPGHCSPKPEPQTASSGPRGAKAKTIARQNRDPGHCSPKAEPQMASSGHQSPKGYPQGNASSAGTQVVPGSSAGTQVVPGSSAGNASSAAAAPSPSSPTAVAEVDSSATETSELEEYEGPVTASAAVPAAGASVAVPAAGGHTQPAPVAAREASSRTATASVQGGDWTSAAEAQRVCAQIKKAKERTEVARRLEKARVERRLGEARAASEKAAVKYREAAEAQRAALAAWAKVEELGDAVSADPLVARQLDPLVGRQLEAARHLEPLISTLTARTEEFLDIVRVKSQDQRRGRSPGPHPPSPRNLAAGSAGKT